MECSSEWITTVGSSETIQATKVTYMSFNKNNNNQVQVEVLTPWGELSQRFLDINITDVYPWKNVDDENEYIEISCLEVWETTTGNPIKIQVCYEPPIKEYTFSSIGYLERIKTYISNDTKVAKPYGMVIRYDTSKCAYWYIYQSGACFGNWNIDNMSQQQIIDQTMENILNRCEAILLNQSFYESNSQYVDDWRIRNPNIIILQGYPTVSTGDCTDLVLFELPSITIDVCENVTCEKICVDTNLYSQRCVEGTCEQYKLIEENSESCGYIKPEEEQPIGTEQPIVGYTIVAGILYGLYALVKGIKKK